MSGFNSKTKAPVPAAGYFVDQKKGEVNELKQLLKNINVEKDIKKKREIIKKVIAYMTLGIDVSRLFTDMIMAIESKDMVIKKMVYLYLCNYAHTQPDMAIMCINTLTRDCDNEDPMVRGLALRSLSNLRLESILEYIERPLRKSLTDSSAYVRKTGVMSVLKIHYLSPKFIDNGGYIAQLYVMIQDIDASVVTNVLMVLNELLLTSKGGIEATQPIVTLLLNRIGEFSEWGLNIVLDLVSRYRPVVDDEIFAIMNLLDPVLRTANSGAVLATIKCFLQLSSSFPELQPQIFFRAKPPLLTLLSGTNYEVQYTVLKHVDAMLNRKAGKGIFDEDYRQFYIRYSEPSHVKYLKVDLLPLISNDNNARDIAAELGEYVTDFDASLSKASLDALGRIAIAVPSVSLPITQTLLDLVDLDIPYVRARAICNACLVVRTQPSLRAILLPLVGKCLRRGTDDADATASVVWLLGEYGEEIVEAPYLIEPVIDSYDEELAPVIKLQLLTAAMKLFFKRPPEVQKMLGRLLSIAVNDSTNQDVHDRALLYFRLLLTDLASASHIFGKYGQNVPAVDEALLFAEEIEDEKRLRIFNEYNSLAVIYSSPSTLFIAPDYQKKQERNEAFTWKEGSLSAPSVESATELESSPSQSITAIETLKEVKDSVAVAAVPIYPTIVLKSDAVSMTAQRFQSLWTSSPESVVVRRPGIVTRMPSSASELETAATSRFVYTMASGPLPTGIGYKFFMYALGHSDNDNVANEEEAPVYLAQLLLSEDGDVLITVKTNSASLPAQSFADILLDLLKDISVIKLNF